jgi:hypothetical protein
MSEDCSSWEGRRSNDRVVGAKNVPPEVTDSAVEVVVHLQRPVPRLSSRSFPRLSTKRCR